MPQDDQDLWISIHSVSQKHPDSGPGYLKEKAMAVRLITMTQLPREFACSKWARSVLTKATTPRHFEFYLHADKVLSVVKDQELTCWPQNYGRNGRACTTTISSRPNRAQMYNKALIYL
jgi:hypothetical protein